MSNELSDWRGMHQAIGKALDGETAESWHKVHAQLLKSVADAQGRLLAAQNETNDRLERMKGVLGGLGASLAELASRQEVQAIRMGGLWDVFSARLDALLAPPRWPVERLHAKRIVKPPQRKQRR